eukprot:3557226-Pyramimonas_sp.AAC.1
MANAAPKMLQETMRSLQDGSEWLRSLPRRPPRNQHSSKTERKSMNVAVSPCRLRWPSEASRQLHEGP